MRLVIEVSMWLSTKPRSLGRRDGQRAAARANSCSPLTRLVALVLLAACGRGHYESIKMSTEMHAQLTSITDDSCVLSHAETERPLEQCVSRDGRVRAWLILDAGGLRGISYELNLTAAEARATLRRAVQGVIDEGLLAALCVDLDAGTPVSDWREGRDVHGSVQIVPGTRKVDIRWVYL